MTSDMTASIGLKSFHTEQVDKSHCLKTIAENPRKDWALSPACIL
jgi:hypothetical protein